MEEVINRSDPADRPRGDGSVTALEFCPPKSRNPDCFQSFLFAILTAFSLCRSTDISFASLTVTGTSHSIAK